jgi:hypothetical protein
METEKLLAEISQLKAELQKEAARLDFVLENEAYMRLAGGPTIVGHMLFSRKEPGECLSGSYFGYTSERDAIDAAMSVAPMMADEELNGDLIGAAEKAGKAHREHQSRALALQMNDQTGVFL